MRMDWAAPISLPPSLKLRRTSAHPGHKLQTLRRSQHGSLHRLRQRNRAEKTLRIKIVISGFIDDPKQAELLGRGIAQRDIDFPLLQRGRMAVVVDAHGGFVIIPSSKQSA